MGLINKTAILSFTLLIFGSLFLSCSQQTEDSVTSNKGLPEDDAVILFQKSEPWIDPDYDLPWREWHESILIEKNEIVPDFTLYTPEGTPFNLYNELSKGKPILLVSGSQTCPISRKKITPVNEIAQKYDDDLTIVMVYTIEPHPFDTVSPYSTTNEIWTERKNIEEGIHVKQQRTYKERKKASKEWQDEYGIKPLMLVDNPNNEFWQTFGQASNMAYLINLDSTVFWRQAILQPRRLERNINLLLKKK